MERDEFKDQAEFILTLLDLREVKVSLCKKCKWSEEVVNLAVNWYRRFLYVKAKYPRKRIYSIHHLIDFVWQEHCLEKKYEDDCNRALGYLVRYNYQFPCGDTLYKKEFGQDMDDLSRMYLAIVNKEKRGLS